MAGLEDKIAVLELCNTLRYEGSQLVDQIANDSGLKEWLEKVELVGQENLQQLNIQELAVIRSRLTSLRQLARSILESLVKNRIIKPEYIHEMNHLLSNFSIQLSVYEHQGRLVQRLESDGGMVEKILFALSESMIHTLSHYDWSRIKQCAAADCIIFFLDTSKAGKRKWCSMQSCGNREKVMRHYRKSKD